MNIHIVVQVTVTFNFRGTQKYRRYFLLLAEVFYTKKPPRCFCLTCQTKNQPNLFILHN